MACQSSGSGEFLITAGTALALQISRQLAVEEMELLAAFLEVLADQLELLALKTPQKVDAETSQRQPNQHSPAGKDIPMRYFDGFEPSS